MIDRLISIDRRIIFGFVAVGLIATTLWPVLLPIRPTSNVRKIYDTIENLKGKKDAVVLVSFDYGPGSAPELQPAAINILRHCMTNDIKVVGMALWPDAVGLAQAAFDSMSTMYGKVYSRDWTFLGYKTGMATLIINMGQDFRSAFGQDMRGTSTAEMEVTRSISRLADFDYVVALAAGNSLDRTAWIPFAVDRYKVKLGGAVTAVMSPDMFPYLQSGQLNGLISGLAGAAEYETLVKAPGSAVRGMAPQSAVHVIIILFIIFGNVMYFLQRRRDRAVRASA